MVAKTKGKDKLISIINLNWTAFENYKCIYRQTRKISNRVYRSYSWEKEGWYKT